MPRWMRSVGEPERADGDGEVALPPVGVDPADRAAVDAPRARLEASMASSAASFGAPVTDPGGNVASTARPADARRAAGPSTVLTRWHEPGVRLDREQRGHLHRAPLAHAAEVVAHEVDDHHVLGPVLGAGSSAATRAVPLIGDERTTAPVARQEALGRRRRHVDAVAGQPHDRAVRRRVALGQGGAERGDVGAVGQRRA